MKTQLLLVTVLLCLSTSVQAQEVLPDTIQQVAESSDADEVILAPPVQPRREPFVGYLSYRAVYEQLPEYEQAKADFAELKAKYEAEATRAEQEFQRKFAEFLSGQKDFPPSIMRKRQLELQDLMEKSISFREQSRKLLAQAEQQMQEAASKRLDTAIRRVGARKGLLFILNTDDKSLPFVHPQAGIDVTQEVLSELNKK